jgi:hypothetical protein
MLSVVTQSVVMLRVLAPFLGICRLIVRPERNKNQIELKKGFDASMTKIRDPSGETNQSFTNGSKQRVFELFIFLLT